ncbi:TIGR02646 family protein [Marinobacter gudaonensis]|uniref:TIGR02646 family protein n=1 Tax=Marinobacter gudaonensis TaxID=375760 RepID=A0A1I6G984_9GAMM|nr:retron system putative HNH endonuclease [Marinobacter gudaonensis]SFR38729.1 TIGR02646 family protein [Marinobacter gudaonensis]
MRHVTKQGNGSYQLNQANRTPPQTSEEATRRWSNFNHKRQVMSYLLDEQYQLCCYSELRADEHGLGYHIEHVENKSQSPRRTFDYTNLAASALDADRIRAFKDEQNEAGLASELFGGHAPGKQRSVNMQLFVSPQQNDCARFFSYLSDGRIIPAQYLNERDSARARYTIDLLNLNSPFLLAERSKWWEELDTLFDEHLSNEMDLHSLAAIDLVPIAQRLSPFFSMTRQFFGRIAEDVLQQDAPELV